MSTETAAPITTPPNFQAAAITTPPDAGAPPAQPPPPAATPPAGSSLEERVKALGAQRREARERGKAAEAAKAQASELAKARDRLAEVEKPPDVTALVKGLPADRQTEILRELVSGEADRQALDDELAKLPEPVRKVPAALNEQGQRLAKLEAELAEQVAFRKKLESDYALAQERMEAAAAKEQAHTIYTRIMAAVPEAEYGILAKWPRKDALVAAAMDDILAKVGEDATQEVLPELAKEAVRRARAALEEDQKAHAALMAPPAAETKAAGVQGLRDMLAQTSDTRERARLLRAHQEQGRDPTPTAAVPVAGGQPGPAQVDPNWLRLSTAERVRDLAARRWPPR